MRDAPPISLAVGRTRAVGVLLDVAAAAAVGFALGQRTHHARLGLAVGAAAGLLAGLRWSVPRAARALEAARPALGSALQAYLEGGGGGLRPQLEGWVVHRLGPAWPWAGLARLGVALALLLLALWLPAPSRPASVPPNAASLATLAVTASLTPPPYTGCPTVPLVLPLVQGLRHSLVQLQVRTTAQRLSWAENGRAPQLLMVEGGQATLAFPLEESGSLRLAVEGDGPVVVLQLEAQTDAPPRVTLLAPAADSKVQHAPGRLVLRASAEDDVRVAALGFRWTLAQGQGEGRRFGNGVVAGHLTKEGRRAEATDQLQPAALGMRAGDTLVVWAEASDDNPLDGPGQGRSEARLLTWEEALVDVSTPGAGARLPPPAAEPTERELLAQTQGLLHASAHGAARRARSAELAEVQRHIRESFGFFLQQESKTGLELDVDEAEVAESGQASGRRLLAKAVSEMWTAEAELALGRPAAALAPERAAVKALDAAFQSQRLALPPPRPPDKPVDEGRRLSGAQAGLRPAPEAVLVPSPPEAPRVEALARRLLLSSEQPLSAEEARGLADALWALPAASGLPAAKLAAPLYAAEDEASRRESARAAAVVLSRWLRPSPDVIPPASSDEASVLGRLAPLAPLP